MIPNHREPTSDARLTIAPDAATILNLSTEALGEFFREAIREHTRMLLKAASSPMILKNAPESAVTMVKLPTRPPVCVKEFRWRGLKYAVKGLFRPTQGVRTFRSGLQLAEKGIGVARPLALIRDSALGLTRSEWVVMEVIPDALELDRYILKRSNEAWTTSERRSLVMTLARFLGSMHAAGIFHSDLKTCNIMVTRDAEALWQPETAAEEPDRQSPDTAQPTRAMPRFLLLDYDDVGFGRRVPMRKKIKNLVQVFLSTPLSIGGTDRMRFLREYGRHAGIDGVRLREMARGVLQSAEGRDILYVGFDGDIIEKWDHRG
ncbi:lipopolysaccharide kinase InaA family protein [Thermodesulfobacteriota bacterium]